MTVYLLFIYISTASSRRVVCLLDDGNKSVIIVLFYAIITQKQDFSFYFRYLLYLPVICYTQQKRSKTTILQQKTGKLLGKYFQRISNAFKALEALGYFLSVSSFFIWSSSNAFLMASGIGTPMMPRFSMMLKPSLAMKKIITAVLTMCCSVSSSSNAPM